MTERLVWVRVLKACWQEVFKGDVVLARALHRAGGLYVTTPNWGTERWALYNNLDSGPEFEILSPLEQLAKEAE